ncbi:MAG: Gfo/Idh/MocA family oxidoreductase [Steroidobacteraceae bacterium]
MYRPRVAIVGAGLMGYWHARYARRCGAEIALVVDTVADRAESLAAKFGARTSDNLLDVAQRHSIEVAHICTPLAHHDAMIAAMLTQNCHVICEKPLARDPNRVEALVNDAVGRQRVLVPVHQFLFQRGVRKLADSRAKLGSVQSIAFEFCSAGADRLGNDAAGSLVEEILPHPVSILESLGLPTHTADWRVLRAKAGEVLATSMLDATVCSIHVSATARPTVAAMTLRGTLATAYVDFFHGYLRLYPGASTRKDKILRPFRDAAGLIGTAGVNLALRGARGEPAYPGLKELIRDSYALMQTPASASGSHTRTVRIYQTCAQLRAAMQQASCR